MPTRLGVFIATRVLTRESAYRFMFVFLCATWANGTLRMARQMGLHRDLWSIFAVLGLTASVAAVYSSYLYLRLMRVVLR